LGGNNSTRYTTTIYNKNNEEILRIEIQCVWGCSKFLNEVWVNILFLLV
jgi:hypothetical protein